MCWDCIGMHRIHSVEAGEKYSSSFPDLWMNLWHMSFCPSKQKKPHPTAVEFCWPRGPLQILVKWILMDWDLRAQWIWNRSRYLIWVTCFIHIRQFKIAFRVWLLDLLSCIMKKWVCDGMQWKFGNALFMILLWLPEIDTWFHHALVSSTLKKKKHTQPYLPQKDTVKINHL